MTKQQAQALYQLTAQPQWAAFVEVQNKIIEELRDELESSTPSLDRLKFVQGQLASIRNILLTRNYAESVLNRNKD